jgi:cyclopropane-fatty-acyl-phospholipid synthase
LEPLDAECLRRHYARTLTCWAERFENCTEAIRSIVGETRYRIWRVYLAGCAHAFAIGNVSIFQLVAQKAGRDADSIPWSRRYVYAKNSAPDV